MIGLLFESTCPVCLEGAQFVMARDDRLVKCPSCLGFLRARVGVELMPLTSSEAILMDVKQARPGSAIEQVKNG